jgi:phage major head subunit gpT-like protein
MALNPVVIERGLRVEFARLMATFLAARMINPGIMSAAMEINSDGAYEKMGWLGAMPVVAEWIGELNAKELKDYDFTIRNRDWASGVPVNQNDLDDDQTSVIQMIPQLLTQRVMSHPEKLMFQLLTSGTTGLAYDGVAFFSNASGARTIDNLLAGTGTSLAQMDADLNAALIEMAKFTDDQGEPLNIKGNLIVCPMAMENNFRRLVNSLGDPTVTGGNTFNPYNGRFTVIGDARLDATDTNDWYLLATGEVMKPFVFSKRQTAQPMFEKTPNTKTWVASANYRGNAGYGIPHLAIKTVNT